MIKYVLFLVIICHCLCSTAQKNLILWSDTQRLTWEDFQDRPVRSSKAGAISSVRISLKYDFQGNDMIVEVYSKFDQKKSWVKDDDMIPSTLEHEQLHFDIAELFARKLRKAVSEYRFKKKPEKAGKQALELHSKLSSQDDLYHDLYDEETTNPRDEVAQKRWVEKIAKELEELEAYSDPTIKIKLK